MQSINFVTVTGNVTSDIHYTVFLHKGKPMPFLRLFMILDGNKPVNGSAPASRIDGLRIVFYGKLAEITEGYVQKGARMLVVGHIQQRREKSGAHVFEVFAERVEFIRGHDLERGRAREREVWGRDPSEEVHWLEAPTYQDEAHEVLDA